MYRLHFTDAAMAALEQLGLDQDRVRLAIDAGWKMQRGENLLVIAHRGLEVEVATVGADYEVRDVRLAQEWPRRRPEHPYLRRQAGKA